ncbi:hypothetical protein ACQPYK_08665 [Streptosporangium sp. CA-135522]|uniref:hypothetical protein n=1 Tax=Streptosporangium sp. CA-135522 TaxID=3240072 RepID=UPI003D89E51E
MSGHKLNLPSADTPWPRYDDGTPVPIEVLNEETRDEWAEDGGHVDDFDGYYDPDAS